MKKLKATLHQWWWWWWWWVISVTCETTTAGLTHEKPLMLTSSTQSNEFSFEL